MVSSMVKISVFFVSIILFVNGASAESNVEVRASFISASAGQCEGYSHLLSAYDSMVKVKKRAEDNLSGMSKTDPKRKENESMVELANSQMASLSTDFKEIRNYEMVTATVALLSPATVEKTKLDGPMGIVRILPMSPVISETETTITIKGTVKVTISGPRACGDIGASGGDFEKAIEDNIKGLFSIK